MSNSPPIRVLVAEDEEPMRAALGDLIGGEQGLVLVGAVANADEAIAEAERLKPDVAVLDVKMPGGGGTRAAAEIRLVSPNTCSVALSAYEDRSNVLGMLRAGAVGYLIKGGPPPELVDAIRRAARRQASLSGNTVAELIGDLTHDINQRAEATEALQRSEERFEALLESVPDAIVVLDSGGRIVLVNRQTERLFDYHRGQLLGQPVELLLPERFHGRHIRHRDGYLANPQPRPMGAGLDLIGRRRDGSEFPVDISLSPIETDGRLAAAFVRGVTEREARADIERGLAERRAMLAHLVATGEEERQRIAGDIHDDSIQVMAAAGMRLQILRRSLSDPEQLTRLAELEQTIQLSISRLRHLIFELRPPALDNEGLSAALRVYLKEANVETTTSYQLDDHLTSQPSPATRLILYRIAQEVLMNVRKHADAQAAVVTLAARDGGYYVRVADDGDGFTPDLNAVRPGHLGLAAIRERAELAGGWLRVESAPGAGTTVEFWIARGTDDEPGEASPAAGAGGGV